VSIGGLDSFHIVGIGKRQAREKIARLGQYLFLRQHLPPPVGEFRFYPQLDFRRYRFPAINAALQGFGAAAGGEDFNLQLQKLQLQPTQNRLVACGEEWPDPALQFVDALDQQGKLLPQPMGGVSA
jgi:hypothetical protein